MPTPASSGRVSRRVSYPAPMATEQRLSIAQVTSHPWGARNEVNEFSTRVASELAERGHRVLIAAPSDSRKQVRESRRAIAAAADRPEALFERLGRRPHQRRRPAGGCARQRHSAASRSRPPCCPAAARRQPFARRAVRGRRLRHRPRPRPVLSERRIGRAQTLAALNVGSFYEPTERILSTQVARPLVEIFLGRLDARTTSCGTTAELMERFFPGAYERLTPGADAVERPYWPTENTHGEGKRPLRIVFCLSEERGALRLFLRAVRRLSLDAAWEVAIWVPDSTEIRIAQRLRDRVRDRRRAREHRRGAGCRRRRRLRLLRGPSAGPRDRPNRPRQRDDSGRLAERALRGADRRRRARPDVPARRRGDAGGPARAPGADAGASPRAPEASRVVPSAIGSRPPTRSRRSTGE